MRAVSVKGLVGESEQSPLGLVTHAWIHRCFRAIWRLAFSTAVSRILSIRDGLPPLSRNAPGATAFGLRSDHVLVELLATFAGQSAFGQRSESLKRRQAPAAHSDETSGYGTRLSSDALDRARQVVGNIATGVDLSASEVAARMKPAPIKPACVD
jgi:hypothetical protein